MHGLDGVVVFNLSEVVKVSTMGFDADELVGMEVTSDPDEAANEFAKGGTLAEVNISETFKHAGNVRVERDLNITEGEVIVDVVSNKHLAGLSGSVEFPLPAGMVVLCGVVRTRDSVVIDDENELDEDSRAFRVSVEKFSEVTHGHRVHNETHCL